MSTYRNYYPWSSSYTAYSPSSTSTSRYSSRLSTSRDNTSGDSKTTLKYGNLSAANYRPTFSSTSGTYRAPRSASLSTYTSRYGTAAAEKETEKEKVKEKEGTPPKKTASTTSTASRYNSSSSLNAAKDNTPSSSSTDLRSRYGSYAPKPKKDEGPPVTYTTRYGKTAAVRQKSRDPSPAATDNKRSLLNTSSASLRARSRDPSPAEPKRTYGTSLSTRDRSRDPSPANARLNVTTIPRRLSIGEKTAAATSSLAETKRAALTYGRSLTTRDGTDTVDKAKGTSSTVYSRKPSRDTSPTEMQKLINQYATTLNLNVGKMTRSRDPSPAEPKRPTITVNRAKARDPSPGMRLKSRETSPVNNYLSMRRASREPSPADTSKPSRFGTTSSGFTSSNYNRYTRNNSNSSLSKYGSSNASLSTRSPMPDQCLSYMTASESRAAITKKPRSDRSSRSSQSSKSEDISKSEAASEPKVQVDVKVEPKIMVTVHVITRATSPTPPGSSSLLRVRRAEVAKTIEKTIQRQLNVKMVDKEIQSDRMDDSTKYSRFNSARSSTSPWSYADLKYSPSPTSSYSRYSNVSPRYSREPSISSMRSEKEKSVSSSSDYEKKDVTPARSKEGSPTTMKSSGSSKSSKTASSKSSKEKSRSPVKQKSPDRPPPVPKAESPVKSVSSSSGSTNGKWANKDFRKSVLNIGPTDRTRKSSTPSSCASTPEEEQSEPKISPPPEKSPARESSVSSESSESSSMTSEVENVKTKASSRTSLLASSDEELPFDKTTAETREKSEEQPKTFLTRTFGPAARISKIKVSHSSADRSWLGNSNATSASDDLLNDQEPERLGSTDHEGNSVSDKAVKFPFKLRHIDSGEKPWWQESENNSEHARKSSTRSKPSSPIKSPPISSAKSTENEMPELAYDEVVIYEQPNDEDEKDWWLGELTPERSKSKSEVPKQSPSPNIAPNFADMHKIRTVQSGDRAWWLTSDTDKSSSKSLSGQWWTTQPNFRPPENNEGGDMYAGLPKFPFTEDDDEHGPLGDRASPEGVEAPINDRKSPYDNVMSSTSDVKDTTVSDKLKKLFISRHTNIDDVLGCSVHPISPIIDRVFSMEEFQEIKPSQVIIHEASTQKPIQQRSSRFPQEDDAKKSFFRRNSYISISKLEISSNTDLVLINSSIINSANQSQFTLYLNFLIDFEVMFLDLIVKHYSKDAYVPSFLNLNVNGCDFLKMKHSVPVLEQLYDNFRQYGKFADRCPIKKDIYYVENMVIPAYVFPAVLPSDKFRIDFVLRQNPARNVGQLGKVLFFIKFKKP